MHPSRDEIAASKVETFMDEIHGFKPDMDWLRGYHPRVYNQGVTRKQLDSSTSELCAFLKLKTPEEIRELSLELQIWWRDHQRADRLRQAEEGLAKKNRALRKAALAKLTDAEKEVLGL